jgi:hypothetical protein
VNRSRQSAVPATGSHNPLHVIPTALRFLDFLNII